MDSSVARVGSNVREYVVRNQEFVIGFLKEVRACSAELCDKNGILGYFVPHINIFLFEPFTDICTSCRNTLLY